MGQRRVHAVSRRTGGVWVQTTGESTMKKLLFIAVLFVLGFKTYFKYETAIAPKRTSPVQRQAALRNPIQPQPARGAFVKQELTQYLNIGILGLSANQKKATETFNSSVRGAGANSNAAYASLKETVIPNYRRVVEGAQAISDKLRTPEVKKLHEKFLLAVTENMNALQTLEGAFELRRNDRIPEVNRRLAKGEALIRRFETELDDMCKKYGVERKKIR
jgi:hypothetical protein